MLMSFSFFVYFYLLGIFFVGYIMRMDEVKLQLILYTIYLRIGYIYHGESKNKK